MNRRKLLRNSLVTASSLGAGPLLNQVGWAAEESTTRRKFTIDLTPGAIGVKAGPGELIGLAAANGFQSLQPNATYLASLDAAGRKAYAGKLREKGLVWGATGLPVEFRKDEDTFQSGLAVLPGLAQGLQDAGVTRVGTWLKPFHDSLTYLDNFQQHVDRLGQVTKILADHGLRFGLEYVGTRTLWTSSKYSFIHTMAEAKELIAKIDQPTLGFILDSWHWFTAGETADDILTLSNSDIVACDLNDAPTGIPIEEQLDNQRELPAATGVIDIASFLQALAKVGYDGPVRAEPFNQPLRELEDEPAAKATADAIRKAIAKAGV